MTNILEIILPELRKIKQNQQEIQLQHQINQQEDGFNLDTIRIRWEEQAGNFKITKHHLKITQQQIEYTTWRRGIPYNQQIEWTDPQLLDKINKILHQ